MNYTSRLKKLDRIASARTGTIEKTVYGVCVNRGGQIEVIRRWKGSIGNMVLTDDEPTILCTEKTEPLLLKHKRVKVMWGGRAGTKSIFAMDAMLGEVNAHGSGVFCLREHMKSLTQSIYRGMLSRVDELKFKGFTPNRSLWQIKHANEGVVSFGGLRNVQDMKSLFNYKFFLLEEADGISQFALDVLGPTLRGVDGSEMWLLFNPKASNDPVSLNYILPYQKAFDSQGYYEDEFHLIVNLDYTDNPWFFMDQSLTTELKKDQHKLDNKLMSRLRYQHIWHGDFLDTIEDGLINPDWVEASFDADKKLNLKPIGATIAASDVADTGDDTTLGVRRGAIVQQLKIIDGENGNRKFDTVCSQCLLLNANIFIWDASALGALLRDQASQHFGDTMVQVKMYRGGESPCFPLAMFKYDQIIEVGGSLTNEDVFYNRRAQDYVGLAERFRLTYDAVVNGNYHDPAKLISLPGDLAVRKQVRSELGRLPLKPHSSGRVLLYSKAEGKRGITQPDGTKVIIPSPNLADTLAMLFSEQYTRVHLTPNDIQYPTPLKSFGGGVEYNRHGR